MSELKLETRNDTVYIKLEDDVMEWMKVFTDDGYMLGFYEDIGKSEFSLPFRMLTPGTIIFRIATRKKNLFSKKIRI